MSVVCMHCERSECEGAEACRAFLATERRRLIQFEPLAALGLDPLMVPSVLRAIFNEHDSTGHKLADWISAAQSDFRFGRLAREPTPHRLREAIAIAVEYMGRVTKAESRAAVLEEGMVQLLEYCSRQTGSGTAQTVSLAIMKLRHGRLEGPEPQPLPTLREIAVAVRDCAGAWDSNTRLIGNIRADELAALAQFVVERLTTLEPSG